jgi:hypothetical protein
VTFRFKASGHASGYECALVRLPSGKHAKQPKARFVSCHSPQSYRQLAAGTYLFELRAVGSGGTQAHPVTHRFTVPAA